MTEAELERRVKEQLNQVGVLSNLDTTRSQFLQAPGLFCEVVLTDGSKLEEARQAVADLSGVLGADGIRLEAVVRALWQVKDVRHIGPCRGESGGIKSAECFEATLICGFAGATVTVEVSQNALDTIRGTLGSKLPEKYFERNKVLQNIVGSFVKQQVDQGGTSYWDPIRFPVIPMNAASFQYVWAHSAA